MANTVSATITDLDGQAWAGGSYAISFQSSQSVPDQPGQTVYAGALDSGGAFSVSLPTGTWRFAISPNASQGGFVSIQVITTTVSLTSQLSALAVGPRFQAGPDAYGYSDTEVLLPVQVGMGYFSVTTQKQRIWNGTAWQTGGGGTSGTVTTVSVVTANGFSGTVANATSTPAITLSQASIGSAVTATTQAVTDSSTKVATTAFVQTVVPAIIYSAAGTPLPAASGPLTGMRAVVSDATTPVFLVAYASGGAVVAPVICNGTAWVIG